MDITIEKSRRKTMSVRILPDGSLLVRAPRTMPDREIRRFLEEKSHWIETHRAKVLEASAVGKKEPLDAQSIRALAEQARMDLPPRVARYAVIMGVTYGKITIRSQRSRWGSCSVAGNLNFNCLLMLSPPEVRDYVVVHELAHRKQMNHSAAFWQEVAQVLPDYRERLSWLKANGGTLLARMNAGVK